MGATISGGSYVSSSADLIDGCVTEAKIADEGITTAKMKKEGTATHVLTSNGAGAVPSYQAIPAGGFTGWSLVETKVVASAIQTYDITVVGDTDYQYMLVCRFVNDAGSTSSYNLRLNAANAAWTKQRIRAEGSGALVSDAGTNITFGAGALAADATAHLDMIMTTKSGENMQCSWKEISGSGGDMTIGGSVITTPNAATAITSIGVAGSQANALGVGTIISLFKRG